MTGQGWGGGRSGFFCFLHFYDEFKSVEACGAGVVESINRIAIPWASPWSALLVCLEAPRQAERFLPLDGRHKLGEDSCRRITIFARQASEPTVLAHLGARCELERSSGCWVRSGG